MSSQIPHVRLEDQKVLKLIERLRQQKLKITTAVTSLKDHRVPEGRVS